MTFKRPQNITLTQMAQWVDANMYQDTCDEETLSEYMYHLIYSYSHKHINYRDYEQLDDFCLYCCSRLFVRIRRNTKSQHIKSIVNYIKTIGNLWYADFLRETSYGSPEATYADFDLFDFSDYLIDVASERDYHSYAICDINPANIVHKYLRKIPVKKHSPEWSNIYISCLLTLNSRIDHLKSVSKDLNDCTDAVYFNRLMRAAKTQKPILFHLDESMENYILTLVNEIMHAISAELSYSVSSSVSVSTCLKNLVIAASEADDD